MTVHIGFQAGTHGNFLRYFLDRFSTLTPKISAMPFTALGTSHSEQIKYSSKFERGHMYERGWPDKNDPHIIITINPNDVLWLQRMNYIRPADRDLNMDTANIIINNFPEDKDAIEKLYGVKIVDSIPRFILRDFCKLGFSDIQNHGLIRIDRFYRARSLPRVYYFPVSAFWEKESFFKHVESANQKFDLQILVDQDAYNVYDQFQNRIQKFTTRDRCGKIIKALNNQENIPITDIDLIEEAYINSWIETTHKNILTPFTNDYFKTTKEILDYIRWYPHFYHGMNPTVPHTSG